LYNLWYDAKECLFNFKEFIDALKIDNYTNKIESEKDIYFDVIFEE